MMLAGTDVLEPEAIATIAWQQLWGSDRSIGWKGSNYEPSGGAEWQYGL